MNRALMPMLLTLLLAVGCASTPRARYAQLQDAYIATVTTLLDAREAGEISQQDWKSDVLPLILLGNTALDKLDAATSAGVDDPTATAQLRDLLEELRPWIISLTGDQ